MNRNKASIFLGLLASSLVLLLVGWWAAPTLIRRLRYWWRGLPYDGPLDVSRITDQLYVAAWPADHNVRELKALGVRLIICMFWEPQARGLKRSPFENVQLGTVDLPFVPLPLSKLQRGVEAALSAFDRGEKVLAYCKQGIHRSVALACCILIAQGYSADEAMALIKAQRTVADPYAWQVQRSVRKFEKYWHSLT